MRRPALALALLALTAGAVPALAAGDSAGPAAQEQVGTVAAPVAIVARVPRTLALTDRRSNGLTGFAFEIDPATVGGPFTLDLAGDPTGLADLQIGFYSSLGTVDQPGVVAGEFIGASAEEAGFVPEGAKTALVYLANGAAASFAYAAEAPLALPLSGELDLTVPKGQAVRWTNDTAETLSIVSAPDEDGFSLFDSGELAPGATFTQPFPDAGTFAYTVGERAGLITVTG